MNTDDELRGGQPLLRVDPDITGLTKFGRSTIYREIATGRLRAVRIGRAVRVRRDDLTAWLGSNAEGGVTALVKHADRLDRAPQ